MPDPETRTEPVSEPEPGSGSPGPELRLRLFNTATHQIEPFRPRNDPVRMFICGPTTYAPAHLGHAKSYLTFDVLRRWLEYNGQRVRHVQNITDVADESAQQAQLQGVTERELTSHFAADFATQMEALGNLPPHGVILASRVVVQTAQVACHLMEQGQAYGTGEGTVFLKATPDDFGGLLGSDLEEVTITEPGGFIPLGGKQDPHDFLLWIPSPSGWQSWDSPLGPGRPGWHTECYLIASAQLGLPLDIHGGGKDLIFPHHESEQLLARHLEGVDYAHHWVHHGLIYDRGGKLSKSRAQQTTLVEVFEDCHPHALRFYLLQDHYREPTYFDPDRLEEACAEGQRLSIMAHEILARCPEPSPEAMDREDEIQLLASRFQAAMDDDLHTDVAVKVIRELDPLASEALAQNDPGFIEAAAALYRCFQAVLGLFPDTNGEEREQIPDQNLELNPKLRSKQRSKQNSEQRPEQENE